MMVGVVRVINVDLAGLENEAWPAVQMGLKRDSAGMANYQRMFGDLLGKR